MNNKEKKLNVIWVVTDSARNFSTGGLDDRDRPEFFDSLNDSFVNFENTVTSAPSKIPNTRVAAHSYSAFLGCVGEKI